MICRTVEGSDDVKVVISQEEEDRILDNGILTGPQKIRYLVFPDNYCVFYLMGFTLIGVLISMGGAGQHMSNWDQ